MASSSSVDGMSDEKETCAPQNEAEDEPQPEKNSLEAAGDDADDPEDHAKPQPSDSPRGDCSEPSDPPRGDCSDPQEPRTARRKKPTARQTKFIPALFYISPLDTSHAMVVVGYVAVLLLSFGTRLYKLGEPDHVW